MTGFRILAALVIFVGAGMSMAAAWDIADILMALMCLINIPACLVLGGTAIKVMKDYERQKRKAGIRSSVRLTWVWILTKWNTGNSNFVLKAHSGN